MGTIGSAFKSVQSGKATLAKGATLDVTIDEVSSKAFVVSSCRGGACGYTVGSTLDYNACSFGIDAEITDSTTLTLTAGSGYGSGITSATIVYSVIDPY